RRQRGYVHGGHLGSLPACQAGRVRGGPQRGGGVVHADEDLLGPVGAELELPRCYLFHKRQCTDSRAAASRLLTIARRVMPWTMSRANSSTRFTASRTSGMPSRLSARTPSSTRSPCSSSGRNGLICPRGPVRCGGCCRRSAPGRPLRISTPNSTR